MRILPFVTIAVSAPLMAGSAWAQKLSEDDGSFRFDSEFSAFYDSNIFGNSDEESDIELAFKPTINFTRRSGLIGLDARVGAALGAFVDNSDQNYQDFFSSFALDYPNDATIPYKLSLGGGYNSGSSLDRFLGERISLESANLNAGFRYNVNERWGFSLNARWSEVTYASGRFTDQSTVGGGFDFVYIYSEKLEIFAGYGYAQTSTTLDFDDHTFRIQAEGEITPKLTGTLGLGYQVRDSSLYGSDGNPYVNLNLAWAVNERMEVAATGAIGYSTTASGTSGQTSSAGIVAAYSFNPAVTASLGVSYNKSEYDNFGLDRSDDYLTYQAAIAWKLGESASLTGSITHENADSTTDQLVYDRLRAGVSFKILF